MKNKFSFRGFQIILLVLTSFLVGFAFGTHKITAAWKDYKPVLSISSKEAPPGQNLDMQLFFEVVDKVNREYFDKSKIDAQKLLYGAISGALQSLDDPYTSFFPPKENRDFKTHLAGEFQGIGAELGMIEDNRVSVVAPLDGSPAKKAGVKNGDVILKVNDKSTFGWTLAKAVEKIRGPKGTTVTLIIIRDGEKKEREIKIIRDVITIKSVAGWVKPVKCEKEACRISESSCPTCKSVAYIRLSQFGDKTNNEWTKLINELYPQVSNANNFRGVILDVRNNPGGYLNDAVFIASEFLDKGIVVIQEDGNGARSQMNVSRRGLLTQPPLIVLINKGSASASEIVAGALTDQKRAKLLGEKSFGKGTIQQADEVDNGASVHISVAKWLTPKGTWVDRKGLEPDIKVELKEVENGDKVRNESEIDNQLARAILELVR